MLHKSGKVILSWYNRFYVTLPINGDVTLGASGLWLGTRTGASGTATLV